MKKLIGKLLGESGIMKFKKSFIFKTIKKNKYNEITSKIKSKITDKNIWVISVPEYKNIGDMAIEYAQKKFLENNYKDFSIIEISDKEFFFVYKDLKKYIKSSDYIYIQGGGNFGNEYPILEWQRKYMIQNFKKNSIVIFPQTFHIKEKGKEKYIKSSKEIYESENLTIALRDKNSVKRLKSVFPKANVEFTPDIVLYLDKKRRGDISESRKGILLCFRQDFEKVISSDFTEKVENIVSDLDAVSKTDTVFAEGENIGLTNSQIVQNKLEEFSKYKLVITDRLHGMIFACITKTPCIAFDNHSKKVSGVNEWIKDLDYIKIANDIEDFNIKLSKMNYKNIKEGNYNIDLGCKYDSLIIKKVGENEK